MTRSVSTRGGLRIDRRRLLQASGGALALAGGLGRPARLLAQEAVRTAAVFTVPVEQQWVSRVHAAAGAAVARGVITYTFSENVAERDYERVMRGYAEAGYDLILGEVFGVEEASRSVALDHPDTAFLMGSGLEPDPTYGNFAVFDNYIQDASYLSGIIAGAMTNTSNIGMVGGFAIPEINRLMNAFMAGAREIQTDIRFQVAFIGSWFDPPEARAAAIAQIEAGADVLYAERAGVIDAAAARGVLAIGNVVNAQIEYPDTVVTSAVWNFEPTLDKALAAVRAGTFTAADYGIYSFMKEGGCSLAPLGTFAGEVPDYAMTLVREREEAIKAGTFTVEIDDSEPTSTPL